MFSKLGRFLVIGIGIVFCDSGLNCLGAKDLPNNQDKWFFLLDQIRSHCEQLKSGECTITGHMYSPKTQRTVGIDHKFQIHQTFVRPLKCRWEGHIPDWIMDPAQAGADAKGNPTAGQKFDYQTILFATKGADAAYWAADYPGDIVLLSRRKAEVRLDRYLYFSDIAYLALYPAFEIDRNFSPEEMFKQLKKRPNVRIDDSGPVWKARGLTSGVKLKNGTIDVVTIMEVDTAKGFTVTNYAYLWRWPDGKEKVQQQITATWESREGVYVPIHYTTQLGFKDSIHYITTEAEVAWSSVNVPLEDSLFEWGALPVPAGTGVVDVRGQNPKIIKEKVIPDPNTLPEQDRKRGWWLYAIPAVGIILIGIYLCRRYFRHSAAPT